MTDIEPKATSLVEENLSNANDTLTILEKYNSEKHLTKEKPKSLESEFHSVKKYVKEQVKQLFDEEVKNLETLHPQGSMYKLQILNKDESDYNLLKKSVLLEKEAAETSNNNFTVFRVIPTQRKTVEPSNSDIKTIMYLHGTRLSNIGSILKSGFISSQKGLEGKGVYMSNSVDIASQYGKTYINLQNTIIINNYLFVNVIRQDDAS